MAWIRLKDGKTFQLRKELRKSIVDKLVFGFNVDFTSSLLDVPKEIVEFVDRSRKGKKK